MKFAYSREFGSVLLLENIVKRRWWSLDLLLFNFLSESKYTVNFDWGGYFVLVHELIGCKMHLLFVIFCHFFTCIGLKNTHCRVFPLNVRGILQLNKLVLQLGVMTVFPALRRRKVIHLKLAAQSRPLVDKHELLGFGDFGIGESIEVVDGVLHTLHRVV